jgi:hypothetical protein
VIGDRGRNVITKRKKKKRGYAVRGEGTEATQRQVDPSTSHPDLMWQLAQHLSVLLQINNKNSGTIANSLNFFQSNWILDSGSTDHIYRK